MGKRKTGPDGVLIYREAIQTLALLPDEQAGRVMKAASAYFLGGEEPDGLELAEKIVFSLLRSGIDASVERFDNVCRRNAEIAEQRRTDAQHETKRDEASPVVTSGDESPQVVQVVNECDQNHLTELNLTEQNLTELNQTELNRTERNGKSVSSDKPTARGARFTPPTVDEVREYCFERGNGVDASRFVDFYSAKGWMVGKNKMRDWKSAVRTWEHDDGGGGYGARNGGFDRNGWPKPLGPLYTDEDYDRAEEEWEAWQAQHQ